MERHGAAWSPRTQDPQAQNGHIEQLGHIERMEQIAHIEHIEQMEQNRRK